MSFKHLITSKRLKKTVPTEQSHADLGLYSLAVLSVSFFSGHELTTLLLLSRVAALTLLVASSLSSREAENT